MSIFISESLQDRLTKETLETQFFQKEEDEVFNVFLRINSYDFEITKIFFYNDQKFKIDLIVNKDEYNRLDDLINESSYANIIVFGKKKIKDIDCKKLFMASVEKEDESLIKLVIINI